MGPADSLICIKIIMIQCRYEYRHQNTIPWVPRLRFDIDQVMRLDHRRDIVIDELTAVIVHDPRFGVFGRLERRLQLDRHGLAVQAHQQLVVHDKRLYASTKLTRK